MRVGDTVVVYAQGPVGLLATAGARLMGASFIIGVDSNESRLRMAKRMGADAVIDFSQQDPVAEVKRLTEGRGCDVAIEALGKQETFENCLRSVRPGGTVSSLGVYAHDIITLIEPYYYGIGDIKIVSTLCPGGKERMNRLMSLVKSGRLDLRHLCTHRFTLDDICEAYEFFASQQNHVMKVAVYPGATRDQIAQLEPAESEICPIEAEEEEEEPLGIFC